MRLLLAFSALALVAAAPVAAQQGSGPDKGKTAEEMHKQDMAEAVQDFWKGAPIEEQAVSSKHSVSVDGRTLK
jgi:hypothetical protein